jgi:hypothetical protein
VSQDPVLGIYDEGSAACVGCWESADFVSFCLVSGCLFRAVMFLETREDVFHSPFRSSASPTVKGHYFAERYTFHLPSSILQSVFLYQVQLEIQGGSNMTGTNCDLFTHKYSRSYLNHLVFCVGFDAGFWILFQYRSKFICLLTYEAKAFLA